MKLTYGKLQHFVKTPFVRPRLGAILYYNITIATITITTTTTTTTTITITITMTITITVYYCYYYYLLLPLARDAEDPIAALLALPRKEPVRFVSAPSFSKNRRFGSVRFLIISIIIYSYNILMIMLMMMMTIMKASGMFGLRSCCSRKA